MTPTDTKTTTVKTTTDVEIPTVDERKLEEYWLILTAGLGEVVAIHNNKKDSDSTLRELAKSKTGEANPRLFQVRSMGVPTDHDLANRKVD